MTAAIAAMGAAMVSLVEHAHDQHGPPPVVWLLSTGAAVAALAVIAVATSLEAWHAKRSLYRPLAATCTAVALLCLALAAAQPSALALVCALVVLLSIPWTVAVTRA